jgi:Tfp pilus assembly protein PilO
MARRQSTMEALGMPLLMLIAALLGLQILRPKLQARLAPKVSARAEVMAARDRLLAMDAGQIERLRSDAAKDRAAVDAFEQQLPEVDGTPALLATLQTQAQALMVALGDLTPMPTAPPGAPVVTPYGATTYVLFARGGWEPILGLVRHLGSSSDMVLPRLDVLKADTTGTVLDAKIFVTVVAKTSQVPDTSAAHAAGASAQGHK